MHVDVSTKVLFHFWGAFYLTLMNGVKKKTIFYCIVIDFGTGRAPA